MLTITHVHSSDRPSLVGSSPAVVVPLLFMITCFFFLSFLFSSACLLSLCPRSVAHHQPAAAAAAGVERQRNADADEPETSDRLLGGRPRRAARCFSFRQYGGMCVFSIKPPEAERRIVVQT
jgi:hypothetical protein